MIVLASPSRTVRKRWQQALSGSCPIHEVVDQVGLRHALTQYKPAVLLLDSDFIHHRGARQLMALFQGNPATRIIFFTDHLDDNEGIAVLKAGARGYCSKKIGGASLKRAIGAVERGELWVARRLISLFIERLVGSAPSRNNGFMNHDKPASSAEPISALSPREHDVASMIAIGEQNKIISSHLSISEKTVKAHLTNIFKKLGLSSRTQLALLVRQSHSFSKSSTKLPQLH
jgi:two-component system NarL family response regulator